MAYNTNSEGLGKWAVIAFIFYIVWNKFFPSNEQQLNETANLDPAQLEEYYKKNDEIQKFKNAGLKSRWTAGFLQEVSNTLYKIMDGFGGNEDEIVHRMIHYVNNDLEFTMLFDAFGNRKPEKFSWFASGGNLVNWLMDDLPTERIAQINDHYKSRGMSKRIK